MFNKQRIYQTKQNQFGINFKATVGEYLGVGNNFVRATLTRLSKWYSISKNYNKKS
jgi:hypothetical protein